MRTGQSHRVIGRRRQAGLEITRLERLSVSYQVLVTEHEAG